MGLICVRELAIRTYKHNTRTTRKDTLTRNFATISFCLFPNTRALAFKCSVYACMAEPSAQGNSAPGQQVRALHPYTRRIGSWYKNIFRCQIYQRFAIYVASCKWTMLTFQMINYSPHFKAIQCQPECSTMLAKLYRRALQQTIRWHDIDMHHCS